MSGTIFYSLPSIKSPFPSLEIILQGFFTPQSYNDYPAIREKSKWKEEKHIPHLFKETFSGTYL